MSELKAGVIRTPHNEGMTFDRGSSRIAVAEDETEFYLKSEADKVIDDLKKSKMAWVHRCCVAEENERRQKYKRCLIIISDIKAAMDNAFFVSGEYLDWLTKWMDRWITIANKFKEE